MRVSAATLLLLTACRAATTNTGTAVERDLGRLPTGAHLDPAGRVVDVRDFPTAAVLSPDGARIVLLLAGYRTNGIRVIDRATGAIRQTLEQPAAFIGLTFSPDGRTLYASGGDENTIYVYAWRGDSAALTGVIALFPRKHNTVKRYPGGIAVAPDGTHLYVAENMTDSLAVVDLATKRVVQRVATGRYPYGVVVAHNGDVFVSAWGDHVVSTYAVQGAGTLVPRARVDVARHPSALMLAGDELYVVSASTDRIDILDTKTLRVTRHIVDPAPGVAEGSTPNALAVSTDGSRLFVAEADNNAVGVIDLRGDSVVGRIPVEWYPTAIVAVPGDTLYVINGKGHGSLPNPATGYKMGARESDPNGYTLGQIDGTMSIVAAPTDPTTLASLTVRVARANGWNVRPRSVYPPIRHVVYVIKENRTYDQVFGDETQGDGDPSLVFFGRFVSPNHHALADRFGLYDRFFVNAEVSADGHNWSTAAYATDYIEKNTPLAYSDRGRPCDCTGTNRGTVPKDGDDVAAPAAGYLWDLAIANGVSLRNYGEFATENGTDASDSVAHGMISASKPILAAHTSPTYMTWDLKITDQARAEVWIDELHGFERQGSMPALEIVRLGNDHTAGLAPHRPTPRAYMADNDLALGRIIEALSRSSFWSSTVVFVVEDDAQDGADHVDSHRAPFIAISPWTIGGVVHRFVNTTDVIRTIEELLGLPGLSQFDSYGRPLREIWRSAPDLTPYTAHPSNIDLAEHNPPRGRLAQLSSALDLRVADAADPEALNHILWEAIKGPGVPYPSVSRASWAVLRGADR